MSPCRPSFTPPPFLPTALFSFILLHGKMIFLCLSMGLSLLLPLPLPPSLPPPPSHLSQDKEAAWRDDIRAKAAAI